MSKKKSKDLEDEDSESKDVVSNVAMEIDKDAKTSTESSSDPWEDDEDRVANFLVTTNPKYKYIRLPQYIKIKNPIDGEVPLFEKRSFPKAARSKLWFSLICCNTPI